MGVIVQTKGMAPVLVNRHGVGSKMISAAGVCSCTCTLE